jgi:hypothetical protein
LITTLPDGTYPADRFGLDLPPLPLLLPLEGGGREEEIGMTASAQRIQLPIILVGQLLLPLSATTRANLPTKHQTFKSHLPDDHL